MESSVKKLGRLCDVMEGKSCCKTKKNECKGKKCTKKVKAKAKNECGKKCSEGKELKPTNELLPVAGQRVPDFSRDGLNVWDLKSGEDAYYQTQGKRNLAIAGNEDQAPLSSTISWSLFKFRSIESVILSLHLILCHPLLLLSSIFPSIDVFSNELALHIRWLFTYWSFSFSISPSNEIKPFQLEKY